MYIINDIEKHNLEITILNCANQIMHLENLLEKATKVANLQDTTMLTLEQLHSAQKTLDNLMPCVPHAEGWNDQDADVQVEKVA